MLRGALLFVFFCGLFPSLWAEENNDYTSNPMVRVYTSRELGLPTNAWSVVQNDRGEMFFGCSDVISFDGNHWQDHPIPGTYAVRGLAADGAKIWVGAHNEVGYLERNTAGRYAYTSLSEKLMPGDRDLNDVWNVFMQDGSPVFVASEKVLRWRNGRFEVFSFPGPLRLAAFQSGGHTFVQHRGDGLYQIDGGAPRLVIPSTPMGDMLIAGGEIQADGKLLLVGNRGFFIWDGRALTNFAPQYNQYLSAKFLSGARRMSDGKFALGTITAGVAVIDADWSKLTEINVSEFAHTSIVLASDNEKDGAFWFVGPGYIARYNPGSQVHLVAARQGLEESLVQAVLVNAGKIAAFTAKGLYEINPRGLRAVKLHRNEEYALQSALPWKEGYLLGGLGGIDYVSPGHEATEISKHQNVLFMAASRFFPGRFYHSSAERLLLEDDDGNYPLKARVLAKLDDIVTSLSEIDADHILLGTGSTGLWFLETNSGTLTQVPLITADWPGENITWVREIGNRRFVVSAAGVFDASINPTHPVLILPENPAHGAPIIAAAPNERNEWWFVFEGTRRSNAIRRYFAKLTIGDDGKAKMIFLDFPRMDAIPLITSLATAVEGDQRRVWIGGSGGIVTAVLSENPVLRRPHKPLLVAVESKRGSVPLSIPGVKLPIEANDLTFSFGSTDYESENQLELQNRLKGFDDDWVPVVNAGQRSIANLPPGDYELQARSVSPAGASSPITSWSFIISPPWYQTTVALLAFSAAAAGLLLGVYQFRTRVIRRQNVQLEEQVRQRTAELEKANSAKTVFVASMSHEIRNPIHGILGLAYSLEGTPLNLLQQQYVGHIRQCANFLTSLVRDVLDFAKIEQEEVSLDFSLFEPPTLVETTVAMCESKAQQAGMTIHTEIDKNLPGHLVGDSARIQQVLLNYLSNAIKYAGEGEIVLRASLVSQSSQELRVRFSVRDMGPGVSSADQERIFTKFSRGKSAQNRSIHGTGLGLAISERIANRMGGRVGVNSPAGEGAEFWLEVPLQFASAPVSAGAKASAPLQAQAKILVADDETYNTLALAGMLHRLNYEVETVSDGAAALDRLLSGSFHAAFLDWELPACSGIEVAREFRKRLPRSGTFLVAITAYNTEHNREACLAAGMNAFLAKPVHLRQLAETLARVSWNDFNPAPVHDLVSADASLDSVSLRLLHYACQANGEPLPKALEEFAAKVRRDLEILTFALTRQDSVPAQKASHSLAGHGAFVGADHFNHLARRANEHSTVGEFQEALALVAQMETAWQQIKDKLESHLASEVYK